MGDRASEEVRDVFVVFPELMQLTVEKTAHSPSKTSLEASGRDKNLLDAPQSDLIRGGFLSYGECTECTFQQAFEIAFHVESEGKFSGC